MHPFRFCARILPFALAAAPLCAQDSVSNSGLATCTLPGDAVAPWDDAATGPFGSEQGDAFQVNVSPFITSWSNVYGIAPILKSGKTGPQFFGSLVSAQGRSRLQRTGVPFASSTYDVWNPLVIGGSSSGYGVNNDPSKNNVPPTVDKSAALGHQFGVAFAESATTGGGAPYNGVVSAVVNYDPTNPSELFVTRRVAAVNGCDDTADVSQFGFGSIDEDGNLVFRADNFGSIVACGLTLVTGNNVFMVDSLARDTSILNVISGESVLGGGQTDAGATAAIVAALGDTANTPGLVPASVTGQGALYIGTDFSTRYVRGFDLLSVKADMSHLATGVTDHRGNIAWSSHNYDFLAGTMGTCAILGQNEDGETKMMNVFGIDAIGDVTGKRALGLPAIITDNSDGTAFTPPVGHEFTHYFSQVAFRGGNGQIAVGRDQAGRLIAAATVDHPAGGATTISQYIAVARVTDAAPGGETIEWAVAAHNDGLGAGKQILDGPGGTPIGQITDFQTISGASLPAIAPPMVDGAGNVWFLAAVEIYDLPTSDFGSALIKANYDPATFSYELELIFDTGTIFPGINAGHNYMVTFLPINDSNSLGSGTAFSQNMSELAHLGMCPVGLATDDEKTLGGLVLNAEIVYDFNDDGQFVQCTGAFGDPLSPDQDYNVLLHIGSISPGTDLDGNGVADEAQFLKGDVVTGSLSAGFTLNFEIQAGLDFAGLDYGVIGTSTGSVPGFDFGGHHIPINPTGPYFPLTLPPTGTALISNQFGTLDAAGKASASFNMPAGFLPPAFVGITLHHAAAALILPQDLKAVGPEAWPVTFTP